MRPIGIEEVLRACRSVTPDDKPSRARDVPPPAEYRGLPSIISRSAYRESLMRLHERHGVPTVDAFFHRVAVHAAKALPEDVQVTFQLDGEGGGTWTVVRTMSGVEILPRAGTWADSLLRCNVARFVDLITGEIDPEQAFAEGALSIEGDLGLLLRLQQALPVAA